MGRINVSKFLIAGLAAAVVANGLDYVINQILMTTEMDAMIRRLNLPMAAVEGSMVAWIVVDVIWGFALVFAYVAIRPRFGPGPGTAVIAGLTLWVPITAVFFGLMSMGMYTQQAYIKSSALQLGSTLLAVLVGAWLYKEDA